MLEKFHEFEKMRRKTNFKLGLFIGVVSVCTAAATVYFVKKALEEKLHELNEDISDETAEAETETTEAETETVSEETTEEA